MAATTETDARLWEYETFAPPGETCPACMKPIGTLDRCRRGSLVQARGPVVVYRHLDCADPDLSEMRRKAAR
ncbi:hypothetical protein E6W17_15670 [Streptomyces sp. A1547]|nr:hypothetical protein E6W17_15670 [Streptomyces sp. A1547]